MNWQADMALIVHRCTGSECRHPDIWSPGTTVERVNRTATAVTGQAQRTGCGQPGCKHHGRKCDWGPPELMREWESLTAPQPLAPIDTIRAPGLWLRGLGTTCGCKECKALYTQLTAQRQPDMEGAR